ncbi:hypothetical protein L873DRAFT_1671617 [Choiromyces venosus 120613-1]|uniref:Xylanolytic transcriptional activator regulatory domain-containing protein n=1 Tax=Choiromyces venosus 120613-1 TaxID=1336337 RepID=A0A3N4K0L4_9PEZI|nr:hypothetical protein L873DRAFT_1671617 [Choiromyces venosus 120613-1]
MLVNHVDTGRLSKRPVCSHCADYKINCYYGEGKREMARKRLQELEERTEAYEKLLRELLPGLDSAAQVTVQNALAVPRISATTRRYHREANVHENILPDPPLDSESELSDDWDSDDNPDHLAEDINTLSINKPTGYMGKSSEVLWINLLKEEIKRCPNSVPADKPNNSEGGAWEQSEEVGSTYHLDDIDISFSGKQIDAYALPPKDLANSLVTLYFERVHPLFPIIYKVLFKNQFELLYQTRDPAKVAGKWLAIMNLVFAISARHLSMIGEDKADIWQHLTFFLRARLLGALDGGLVFEIATLQDVQAMGLTGMYLLASKQTNRYSWNVAGLAIRLAYGMGLHLRNIASTLNADQKEMRVRVWYSVCYLETTLGLITGRPSALQAHQSSAPLPRSKDFDLECDPAQDAYFAALMKLSSIASEVLSQLYSTRSRLAMQKNWEHVQKTMEKFDRRLERWKSKLIPRLSFNDARDNSDDHNYFVSQRIDLALRYHNIRILIFRPCICQLETGVARETGFSEEFNRSGARACISSARNIVSLVVNTTGDKPQQLIKIPWWCVLHYLVAAEAILLLETIHQTASNVDEGIVNDMCQVVKWLQEISGSDMANVNNFGAQRSGIGGVGQEDERGWLRDDFALHMAEQGQMRVEDDMEDFERNLGVQYQ